MGDQEVKRVPPHVGVRLNDAKERLYRVVSEAPRKDRTEVREQIENTVRKILDLWQNKRE